MKQFLLSFLFSGLFFCGVFAQTVMSEEDVKTEFMKKSIKESFSSSNYNNIGKLMLPSIVINIFSYNGPFSSKQATIILKDFFSTQPVSEFNIVKQGITKTNNPFLVGLYQSENAIFNVYISFKEDSGKLFIYKLNIREKNPDEQ